MQCARALSISLQGDPAFVRRSALLYTHSMALRLYAATTSAGKLRDFRTAAQAYSVNIDPLPDIEKIPAPQKTATRSPPTPRSRRSTTRVSLRASWFWPTTPASKSMRFRALRGFARRALPQTLALVDSPDANDNTDVWNNMVLLQRMAGVPCDAAHCALSLRARGRTRRSGLPYGRWRGRRRDSRCAARNRRLWLRSAVLPARAGEDHGRDRS